MATSAKSKASKAIAAVCLLSLLWALDGLGPDLLPTLRHLPIPGMERQAIICTVVAALAAAYAGSRGAKWPGGRRALVWVGIGLLLFAAPVMLAAAAQGWVSRLERVAIFLLTPVFAVVLEPHLGNVNQRGNGGLVAALAAVAGALCIFPLDLPGTPGAVIAVLAILLAAACAAIGNCVAVRFASSGGDGSLVFCAALACGSAAFAFATASAFTEHAQGHSLYATQLAWLAIIDVPALMLLFWLLRQISAVRMTTRFILAPLLTVIAGIAIEQPAITTRMILGILLMAAGAGWILWAPEDDVQRDSTWIG